MEALKNFNAKQMFERLALPDGEFDDWLRGMGLFHTKRTCECGARMRLRVPQHNERYGKWRCTRKRGCGKEMGYLVGTWFEGTRLTVKEIFQLSYYFARQTHSQDEIQFDMQRADGSTISERTIVEWKHFYREVCMQAIVSEPILIGGPGKVVEIDETVITKRKYHRGQLRAEEQWFFGGVERGDSTKVFLVPVEKRDAATLLPILAKHVLEGSTVISDGWAAYGGIERIQMEQSEEQAYSHFVVNHSEHFVDPETHAHTQTIEGTWSHFKARHKEERGTARSVFSSYLYQFMWRKKHKGPDALYHLWRAIARFYPCEQEDREEEGS